MPDVDSPPPQPVDPRPPQRGYFWWLVAAVLLTAACGTVVLDLLLHREVSEPQGTFANGDVLVWAAHDRWLSGPHHELRRMAGDSIVARVPHWESFLVAVVDERVLVRRHDRLIRVLNARLETETEITPGPGTDRFGQFHLTDELIVFQSNDATFGTCSIDVRGRADFAMRYRVADCSTPEPLGSLLMLRANAGGVGVLEASSVYWLFTATTGRDACFFDGGATWIRSADGRRMAWDRNGLIELEAFAGRDSELGCLLCPEDTLVVWGPTGRNFEDAATPVVVPGLHEDAMISVRRFERARGRLLDAWSINRAARDSSTPSCDEGSVVWPDFGIPAREQSAPGSAP